MQQLIFFLFFLTAIYSLYQAFKSNSQFFSLLGMAFNFGTGAGLLISGIDFLHQVDSNGIFIYVSQTAANNPFIGVLGMVHVVLGFLCLYWFFRILGENNWQIRIM